VPLINNTSSILTGASAQPLLGSQFEYLPYNARIEIGIIANVTGVLADVSSGSDILQESGPVGVGTINVFPKYPDDFYLVDVAAAGDRLKINLRNPTGGTIVVMTTVRITPL
jgi:hypothetical protein